MSETLFTATINRVPYSSVVGSSLAISMDGVGVVALIMISVPQPHLDYKTVADAVTNAIIRGYINYKEGTITLVLPDDFKARAAAALNAKEPQT